MQNHADKTRLTVTIILQIIVLHLLPERSPSAVYPVSVVRWIPLIRCGSNLSVRGGYWGPILGTGPEGEKRWADKVRTRGGERMSRFGWLLDPYVEPTPRWVRIVEIVLVVLFVLAIIGLVIWLLWNFPERVLTSLDWVSCEPSLTS